MDTVQTPARRAKKVPLVVVVLVLLLALAGGVMVLAHWLKEDPKTGEAVVLDPSQFQGNGRMNRMMRPNNAPNASNAITARKDGSVFVNIGTLHMNTSAKLGGPLDIHNHASEQWVTAQQLELLNLAERIVRIAERNKKLAWVSDEQVRKLKQAPTGTQPQLVVSDQDKARLADLLSAWQKAAGPEKAAAEKVLLTALKEIGDKGEALAKQAIAAGAQSVKNILTPEQIERFRAMRNGAATRPANTANTTAAPTTTKTP